jgi:hypothetical protein
MDGQIHTSAAVIPKEEYQSQLKSDAAATSNSARSSGIFLLIA